MHHQISFIAVLAALSISNAQYVNISGKVIDTKGTAISGAAVSLEKGGQKAATDTDGKFSLMSGTFVFNHSENSAAPQPFEAAIHNNQLSISVSEPSPLTITAFSLQGKALSTVMRHMDAGAHSITLPGSGAGVTFYKINSGNHTVILKGCSIAGMGLKNAGAVQGLFLSGVLAKQTTVTAVFNDVLTVKKSGYQDYSMTITTADTSGIEIQMKDVVDEKLEKFSFFVTSLKALVELSGSEDGFGGDLRFGETGPGAGLRGADKICRTIAEKSMKGSAAKEWRALLSVTADENGKQVNAIDRIGNGPWYDRLGRLLAPTKADLLNTRPEKGDPTIKNDLPNEDGVPNHRPDPNKAQVDNHHMITGSGEDGKLYRGNSTCKDWTSSEGSSESGKPRCGFSWPRRMGGGGKRGSHWLSGYSAPGCKAGVDIHGKGAAPKGSVEIGGGGGYGGFYCFALTP